MPGIHGNSSGDHPGERAQSSVIGVVLVLAITVLGVSGILLFGTGTIGDARAQSEVDAAEHAMTQLDSRFSLVALGSSPFHGSSVTLRSGSDMRVDGDAGWMNVSVVNRTTGNVEDPIFNQSLGAVIYENDGTTIAYQGGGVWKRQQSGASVMVSPPEFHYRTRRGEDPTLTLPLVVVRGSGSLTEHASVSKDGTTAHYPVDGDPDRTNPLEEGEINVTVHSDYYEAWGEFFAERTGGSVAYDHTRETVTITLVIDDSAASVAGGIVSGASNELVVRKQAKIDSYNSSDGPYGTGNDNNTIVSSGSVSLEKNAMVEGNLRTAGSVTMDTGATVTGSIDEEADVTSPRAVDWLIDQRREEIEGSPDSSPCIDASDRLGDCSPPYTLTAGEYYLDEVNLGGDTLELDTSSGDVTVVVDGDMDIEGSKVTVNGPHTARFYVEGDLSPKNSNVSVAGDRSPLMWIYMNPGAEVDMFSQSEFVGVVYGPGNGANNGVDIRLKNQVEVYGGLVGELTEGIDQKQDIHYDEALVREDPLTGYGNDQPKVTYMHVTVNAVNVSSR